MASSIFSITRISGYNDTDAPTDVAADQCVVAENVEFYNSALGERRLGCDDISLPASITGDANIQAITWLKRHLPTTVETASELWVLGQHLTTQNYVLTRKTTSWTSASLKSPLSTSNDNIDVTNNRGFSMQGITLHGKLFLAYKSVGSIDRLHVVDPSTTEIRRVGLAEPSAPTAADTGTPGVAYTGTRYFRVRYKYVNGSIVTRSEPSDVLTFAPSGTGTAARITKPASISEGETHWEVEASVDNANFYRIATVVVGTTTYDDSTVYASGYASASGAVLSADSGDYTPPHSGKYLAADEDRLLIGGSHEDSALASSVVWTPRFNDPGDGNDERIPISTTNRLDLDGFEGGPLTFLSNPVNGANWAFKRSHTYKLIRTGQRNRAYEAVNISKTLGALEGSVVEGVDQLGMPCLYFLDPEVGPCRTGGNRVVQSASRDVLNTWAEVNTDAIIVSRAYFNPEKMQVHWFLATGDEDFPEIQLVLQTNNSRETEDGVRGGYARWDGIICNAYSACMYAENIDADTTRSLILKPLIGVSAANGYVLQCDTGDDDNGTAYHARIISRPFVLRDLLSEFKILAAAVLAKAHATAQVAINFIRDIGAEESSAVTKTLAASGTETQVRKLLSVGECALSAGYAVQVQFEDVGSPTGQWQINRFDMLKSDQGTKT